MKLGAQVAYFVINYLKELDRLNKHVPERRVHTARWVAPLGLRFKINFNVAFNKHRNELCSGLVVRNEKVNVIFSKTIMNANILPVFTTEAMACFQALNLKIHLGLREVEVEEYSRSVICKLQKEKEDRLKLQRL
ncbi:hypothetical protein PVK06_019959 [Gossypium arboreum]|uniref:RNase H type-1 domain-containing protein n=1 Tax=Gossypium arboreum TaxID=29729 RepID=A0ABR0PL33_GOSAR|nr:hypothetical protein PVK06_019959 [Gossypium arboreum]